MQLHKLMAVNLAVGLALGFTGCAPASNTPTPDASGSEIGWDINEQDRDQVAQGGEFRGSVSELATNWNWNSVESAAWDYAQVRDAMSAHYFLYDFTGMPHANPDYIDAVAENNDPYTLITLSMNPKAVWGDGQVVTAKDWIATWQAMRGTNTQFHAVAGGGWSSLKNVAQGVDEHQVVFTFTSVYPDWRQIVAKGPMRAESCATPDAFNNGWSTLNNNYFSGPFKVENLDKTQQIVTLVPNDRWWGARPKLDKITWRVVTVDAVASAFQSNELDYFEIGVDADAFSRASEVADAEIRTAPSSDFRQFTFNTSRGVLTDVKVRQAIVMGLDRQAIAASDLAGLEVNPGPLNNNVYMTNQAGYEDMATKTGIDFDTDQAKKLLEEAGWAMNQTSGFYEKNGKQLTIHFKQVTGVKASENEALQAQQMLKAIGVNVVIDSVAAANFDENTLAGGDWDLIAFAWVGTAFPFAGVRQLYSTGSQSNFAHASIAGLSDVLDEIDVTTDSEKRISLGNQAAELIWTSVAVLPLYQRPDLIAVKKSLANIGARGFGTIVWENVGYTK